MSEQILPPILLDFINYMETIKGKSINTSKEYIYDLRLFLKYMKKYKNDLDEDIINVKISDININLIKKITLSDLYSYMSYVSRERDNNANARARKVASIRSFFNYLTNKAKLLSQNPAAELESPKIMKKLPRYLTIEESKKLLSSIKGKHHIRDYAIITLFLNCGLRLTELVNINLNSIKNDTLRVLGKGDKERTIYLNNACLKAIRRYMVVRPLEGLKDRNALFVSERKQRISSKTIQYLVRKYIIFAGLDPERYSTHKLRHTAATLMYKHGNVDIRALQEILGHESIATTEIYTHVDSSKLRKAVQSNPLSDIEED